MGMMHRLSSGTYTESKEIKGWTVYVQVGSITESAGLHLSAGRD